jgi:hypothetical protein
MVEEIMMRLFMSKRDVVNALKNILESTEDGCEVFDPSRRMKAAEFGKPIIINDMDPSAHIVYKAVSNGTSITMATYLVNLHRDACNLEIVSRSTISNFIDRSKMIVKSLRDTQKSGSSDINSKWATGRLIFALQLKEMFRLGFRYKILIFVMVFSYIVCILQLFYLLTMQMFSIQSYSAMERIWSIIPSKRIVDDISDWPRVNDKIIEARGGMIEGENLRSGRRQLKKDGVTLMKSRLSTRDRKETLTSFPIHPDAKNGFDALVSFGNDKYREALDEVIELDDSDSDDDNNDEERDADDGID